MKLNVKKLKKVIKEELDKVLREQENPVVDLFRASGRVDGVENLENIFNKMKDERLSLQKALEQVFEDEISRRAYKNSFRMRSVKPEHLEAVNISKLGDEARERIKARANKKPSGKGPVPGEHERRMSSGYYGKLD